MGLRSVAYRSSEGNYEVKLPGLDLVWIYFYTIHNIIVMILHPTLAFCPLLVACPNKDCCRDQRCWLEEPTSCNAKLMANQMVVGKSTRQWMTKTPKLWSFVCLNHTLVLMSRQVDGPMCPFKTTQVKLIAVVVGIAGRVTLLPHNGHLDLN